MTRQGREFELLVTRIEELLVPKGAVIKSPDHLVDMDGQTREVDASIRYQVGSTSVLIVIECRDRADPQDVTWIEQLVTKKQSIGASELIAVSPRGFSQTAIHCAKRLGIELRRVADVTDAEILEWADKLVCEIVECTCRVQELLLELYTDESTRGATIDQSLCDRFLKDDVYAPIFTQKADGTQLNLLQFLHPPKDAKPAQILERNRGYQFTLAPKASVTFGEPAGILFEGVPLDSTRVSMTFKITFPPEQVQVATTKGPLDVKRIQLKVELSRRVKRISPTRTIEYFDTSDKTIAHITETEINLGDPKGTTLILSTHQIPRKEGTSEPGQEGTPTVEPTEGLADGESADESPD